MSSDDFFRRYGWRSPFFRRFFGSGLDVFREMERLFEETMREMQETLPRELVREKKLRDGRTIREIGPIVYGYSVTIGPDGKPRIEEFGNVRPNRRLRPGAAPVEVAPYREPLVEVREEEDQVQVLAELPGCTKEEIQVHAEEETLTVRVDTERRKFQKELELPAAVDPASAQARYNNGVLEITLRKRRPSKPSGTPVKIE